MVNETPYFCCGNLPSEGHTKACLDSNDHDSLIDGERISCGCCRGVEGHRCVCWMHQDVRMGRPAGVCSLHADDARPSMPHRYAR